MKKLIPVLLAAVMLVGLASCAKKADEKVLRVGMECAYAPYNWTQSDDKNGAVKIADSPDYAYGYDVMMAKYIAEKIGYKLEVHKTDWTSIPLGVQAGTLDAGICGQSITDEHADILDFSVPYYYADIVFLVKSDSAFASATGVSGFAGAKITSQLGTIWYDQVLPRIEGVEVLPAMDDTAAMYVALESGACDILLLDKPAAMAAVNAYPDMKIMDFTGSADNVQVLDEEVNIGVSVKKGNADLLKKINDALATLTKDDYERMMADAIKQQPMSEG
jgi:putative lysine transport system substrate-binding protein